ncbi:hypothetical protein CEXT_299091 [Caerostris extrusa]|uniref:Uncharacterized protein n=1 Tax=Caerostris extrusa TaxID=172846 RepID=A0AAV4RDK5_CAEEX|nr:hypothetical protein CEXT_299091 [Caerostris extrusa]
MNYGLLLLPALRRTLASITAGKVVTALQKRYLQKLSLIEKRLKKAVLHSISFPRPPEDRGKNLPSLLEEELNYGLLPLPALRRTPRFNHSPEKAVTALQRKIFTKLSLIEKAVKKLCTDFVPCSKSSNALMRKGPFLHFECSFEVSSPPRRQGKKNLPSLLEEELNYGLLPLPTLRTPRFNHSPEKAVTALQKDIYKIVPNRKSG